MEAVVFGDRAAARRYTAAAERVRDGIFRSLFDEGTGLYHVAKHVGGVDEANLDVWYPGTVPIAWPHLFGVTAGDSDIAQAQMAALNESWDGSPNPDWTTNVVDPSGFLWPSIGYAALLTGDCDRARRHANFVKELKFPNEHDPVGFAWPFTVGDGGWLLRTLSTHNGHDTDLQQTDVCGTIGTETWTTAGSPYVLTCDVAVTGTLTIEPGTVVMGQSSAQLTVQGHLSALGTPTQPITFTSAEDTGKWQWQGLVFDGGTGHLRHAVVRYGGRGDNSVLGCCKGSNVSVRNVLTGEVRIESSQVISESFGTGNNVDYGLYVDNSQVVVSDTLFADNGYNDKDYGLYATGAGTLVTVTHSTFQENTGDGIAIDDGQASVSCSTFVSNTVGVRVRSGGSPSVVVNDSNINGNVTGVSNGNASVTVDARDNWWGALDGPSGDGSGSGDSVIGNVLFDPWRTAESPCALPEPDFRFIGHDNVESTAVHEDFLAVVSFGGENTFVKRTLIRIDPATAQATVVCRDCLSLPDADGAPDFFACTLSMAPDGTLYTVRIRTDERGTPDDRTGDYVKRQLVTLDPDLGTVSQVIGDLRPDPSDPTDRSMFVCGSTFRTLAENVPDINATPNPVDFGDIVVGDVATQTVTVSNVGSAALNISSVTSPAAPFSITADGCAGQTLSPSGSCTIEVQFAPAAAGAFAGSFTIASDDPDEPNYVVGLQGTGVSDSPPDFTLACEPASLDILQGESKTSICTVTSLEGFNDEVDLTCEAGLTDIKCSLNPTQVTPLPNDEVRSTLTVIVESGAPVGSGAVRVTGTSGSLSHSTVVEVNVVPPIALRAETLVVDNPRIIPSHLLGVSLAETSNENGVLEPDEAVIVEPGWTNLGAAPVSVTGQVLKFTGPGDAGYYAIQDDAADYGIINSLAIFRRAVRTPSIWAASSPSTSRPIACATSCRS